MLYLQEIRHSPYWFELHNQLRGEKVDAILTSEIQMRTGSSWDEVAAAPGGELIGTMAHILFDRSTIVQSFSRLVWKGVEAVEFSFTFSFVGITSIEQDVMLPAKELLTWTVPPEVKQGFLMPPATTTMELPIVGEELKPGMCCYVKNAWLLIRDLYPVSADITFGKTLSSSPTGFAKPYMSTATMSFRLGFAPSANQVLSWFI